jgi:hypothetical protein
MNELGDYLTGRDNLKAEVARLTAELASSVMRVHNQRKEIYVLTGARDAAIAELAARTTERDGLLRERQALSFAAGNVAMHTGWPVEAQKALIACGEDRDELQATFDLRWKADMRAIKTWQAAHPGNELVWPDHADLCTWLAEERDSWRTKAEGLAAALDESVEFARRVASALMMGQRPQDALGCWLTSDHRGDAKTILAALKARAKAEGLAKAATKFRLTALMVGDPDREIYRDCADELDRMAAQGGENV